MWHAVTDAGTATDVALASAEAGAVVSAAAVAAAVTPVRVKGTSDPFGR